MDIQPDNQQTRTISDDQELAKVLAGVSQDDDAPAATPVEDTMLPTPPTPMPADPVAADPATDGVVDPTEIVEEMPLPPVAAPEPVMPASASDGGALDSIKQQALGELRPLVDKLNVSAEEKFDTYLLLLRSTDDKDLIAPAHEAARSIEDETKRAQALLDIIKEIDFLSQAQQ